MRLALTAAGSAALLTALATPAQAEESGWSFAGAVRARYEAIDGQARPNLPKSDDLLTFRTVLTAEYDAGRLKFVGELWDSRAYGASDGLDLSVNEVNTLEPLQAHVVADLGAMLGGEASLKVGRFTMDLGSRRLVVNDDYRNTTNGFTGVRLDVKQPRGGSITAFYTAPQIRLPSDRDAVRDNEPGLDRESGDLVFWGLAATRPTPWARTTVDAAFLKLDERDRADLASRDRHLSTVSARILRTPSPGDFDFEAEGAWQTGEASASTQAAAPRLDVSAGMLQLRAGYQFTDAWKTRVALEYAWVSGDDADPKYRRFDTLFGSRRGDLAPSGIYNAVGRANISSPAVRVEVTPTKRLEAMAVLRPLWLDAATDSFSTSGLRDASGASGDYAGTQLETRVRYWLVPDSLRFEGNAVWLARGDFMKSAPNAPPWDDDTRYLSLNLTWSF